MRVISQQEREKMAVAKNNLAQMRAAMAEAACDHCGGQSITFSFDGGAGVWFHCADGYREHLAALRASVPSRAELAERVNRAISAA
ncbi:MAG TPA: hypothetical protein VF167_08435 [Longimicrobiaceae bacterium]